jgi:hypothetical protein
MNKFKNYIWMAAGFVVLAAVVSGVTVAPAVAQMVKAALVRDVDNPALQPVAIPLTDTFKVPSGKRLVIEYVSWRGTANQGFVVAAGIATVTNGVSLIHYVPGVPVTGENIGGEKVFIVADPGSTVTYQSAGAIGSPVVLSGYYVNIP